MPEPAQLVAAADTLAEASLYNEAISTYSKAIELNPTAPTYYLKRYFSSFVASRLP
jgi:TPR repeat